ncbi:reverse transcriptase-like protein [Acidovorax sp. LjRoot117]|uniref:reverse transcriptase-like protein n=1 Tax=Acidovorax sp. LjRoot117 TaxID=3342255 RepID=UPI003ED04611
MPDDNAAPWVIHCDGSAVPNPGRMGLGAVVRAPDGTVAQQLSEATTFTGCNNEAELRALALALRWLQDQDGAAGSAVVVYSDSSVLVEQLGADRSSNSLPVPPIARLAGLFDEVRAMMQACGDVSVQWIPRHRNGQADALARGALGLAPKPSTGHHTRTKKKRQKRR